MSTTTRKKIMAGIAGTLTALSLSACSFEVAGFGFGDSDKTTESAEADGAEAEAAAEPDDAEPVSGSPTEESATAESEEPDTSETEASSSSADLTPGGEKLSLGETATVQTENHTGAVFTYEITLTDIRDLPAGEVESQTGGPLDVSGDPNFVVDSYQCLDFEVTYLGMEGGDGSEFQTVPNPSLSMDAIDSNGLRANSLITTDAETLCGDGSLADMPNSLKDLSEGETYYLAMMGFTDAAEKGKAAGAEFEYDLESNPSASGTKFSWR